MVEHGPEVGYAAISDLINDSYIEFLERYLKRNCFTVQAMKRVSKARKEMKRAKHSDSGS